MDLTLPFAAVAILALLAIYVPTLYLRKANKILALLEKIEANTRKQVS
jgi:hypothetical protein